MPIFESAGLYIQSKQSARDKIAAIDQIISALLVMAADSASKGNIEEYNLNDGQTIIRTRYRSMEAVMASIQSFETLKTYYVNQINGNMMRLTDSSNFNPKNNGTR
jgi:hypothetical protein